MQEGVRLTITYLLLIYSEENFQMLYWTWRTSKQVQTTYYPWECWWTFKIPALYLWQVLSTKVASRQDNDIVRPLFSGIF